MYGEVCARSMEVIYRGDNYNCSPCYYTWKENKDYPWDMNPESWDSVVAIPTQTEGSADYQTVSGHVNWESVQQSALDDKGHAASILRKSSNHKLNGNEYHTPDYTDHSGLNVIDFAMHWNFNSAQGAYGVRTQDDLYNDATYNVVYVDSHDYAPDSNYRFKGTQDTWAENLSLMFTFRGIPCIYYGSEVEFQKGKDIDKGAVLALKETGRAYFGGYIEGDVKVSDFAEYTDATGNLASTLSYPLAKHIQRLNKIRAAVPALRKGQYSNDGCSGKMAFKRRYTDSTTDSYVLVTISGDATFTGVLNGRYVDAITGDVQNVSDGKLTAKCSGKGNLRVYVLDTDKTKAPGKVGEDGKYLYATKAATEEWVEWPDETMPEETWTVKPNPTPGPTPGGERVEPDEPIAPAMAEGEQAVFFEHESWNPVSAWIWSGGTNYTGGNWPGQSLTYLGNNVYKWTYTGSGKIPESAKVIFSNAGNNQCSKDGWDFVNGGYYTSSGYLKTIPGAGEIPDDPIIPGVETTYTYYFDNSDANWSNVYAYFWDKDNPGDTNMFGGWPGTKLNQSGDYYVATFTTDKTFGHPMIIFNGGSGQAQTSDLEAVNHGIYTKDGYKETHVSTVENIAGADELKIYTVGHSLVIETPKAGTISVASLDGCQRILNLAEGVNVFVDYAPGFYIVGNKKIVVK